MQHGDTGHDIFIDGMKGGKRLLKMIRKMIMQNCFISLVVFQAAGIMMLVGVGKGIRGIVNQLSKIVIFQDSKLCFSVEPVGQPLHIGSGIAEIVSTEKLVAERSLAICEGV